MIITPTLSDVDTKGNVSNRRLVSADNYKIDFGRTINVESKFKNYKAFFQKAEADSSLVNYKKINLRFTQKSFVQKNRLWKKRTLQLD